MLFLASPNAPVANVASTFHVPREFVQPIIHALYLAIFKPFTYDHGERERGGSREQFSRKST